MNEKPRIVLLNYHFTVLGGISRVASQLAAQLHDACEVHLVSLTGEGDFPHPLPPDVPFTVLVPGEYRIRQSFLPGGNALRRYCREHRIQAVFVLGGWSGVAALFGTMGAKVRVVHCDHGTISAPNWDRRSHIELWIEYHLFDHFTVLTEGAKTVLERLYPTACGKITVIPNAIAISNNPVSTSRTTRELVTVTRLSEEKGLPQLVETAALLRQSCPDFVWRIWGDGPERESVNADIAAHHLERNVLLMGQTDDVAAAYARAGVFVLTSEREGLPMVLLEAKAAGLPCVSFDISFGPADLIREGVDGFLIPYGDCAAMAERLKQLLSDDGLAHSMAENARGNLDKYCPDAIRAQWLALIHNLTSHS